MMRRWFLMGALCGGGLIAGACAQTPLYKDEGLQWLQKAAMAGQRLSFSGVFVYRAGAKTETTRITHLATPKRRIERLETLDGSPREVLLVDDEVKCYLPEDRLVVIEQRAANRRSFPALALSRLHQLAEHYAIQDEGPARVAGFESRRIVLTPRDAWRYGRRFWLERESGLLLRAEIFAGPREVLESVAFTELRLGAPHPSEMRSLFAEAASDKQAPWQVRQARAREVREETSWHMRTEIPGFRRQAALARTVSSPDGQLREMLHWIYSDGMSSFSVFISPLGGEEAGSETSPTTMGAISIARRVVQGHQVVVMGEVPPATIQKAIDNIGIRP
ncbi:MAG: MucB/RseB C-terminal domain-containing protein [Rhodocyclaceae bacterium]|nr:MucB/RseB C-terminal domain-containing protein [Rhodocyclaceae bacterium]